MVACDPCRNVPPPKGAHQSLLRPSFPLLQVSIGFLAGLEWVSFLQFPAFLVITDGPLWVDVGYFERIALLKHIPVEFHGGLDAAPTGFGSHFDKHDAEMSPALEASSAPPQAAGNNSADGDDCRREERARASCSMRCKTPAASGSMAKLLLILRRRATQ